MAIKKSLFCLNLVDISIDNQRPPGVRKIRQLDSRTQCFFKFKMHSSLQGPCCILFQQK
jgi:hypothetical protein